MTETPSASEARALTAHNGTYTIDHREVGHFTVKLYTVDKGDLAGKRILALLVGPDNRADFRGIAFWDDDRKRVNVWKKHRGPDSRLPLDGYHWQDRGWSRAEQKLAIWSDLAIRGATDARHGHWFAEGYRMLLEGRCVVCNRALTHPDSIRSGIGPTCAGRA